MVNRSQTYSCHSAFTSHTLCVRAYVCVCVCCLNECVFWPTGDFAVLLKAGMSVKQAIVYNLLSALMAYVGMLIGTAVGQYTHNVTNWIFAITAGMFLYVALVDMVSWLSALHSPRVIIVPRLRLLSHTRAVARILVAS